MPQQTILYARVSTLDQTAAHQEAQARATGFDITETLEETVSGVSTGLAERPQGKRLFDKLRAGDVLVVRWVDRLGRNYEDVVEVIREFMRRGVVIKTVINAMTFDGSASDPMQKAVRDAMIAFMAASAQAQAEATKAAQRAGIEHAKRLDEEAGRSRYLGRKPSFTRSELDAVMGLLAQGKGLSEISREAKLSRQTVHRIKTAPDAAEKALAAWGL